MPLSARMEVAEEIIWKRKAWVKYTAKDAVDSKSFNMTIQNGPNYQYRKVIKSATAKKGEWTQITGEYTMPDDAITDQNYIFFETGWVSSPKKTDDLMDFYVDNVTITEKNVEKELPDAGEHDYNGSDLDLVWQWNHNPNNNNWSLTDRAGWLRLQAWYAVLLCLPLNRPLRSQFPSHGRRG